MLATAPPRTHRAGRTLRLDLREVTDAQAHSLVFERLDDLGPGDRLLVVCDCEPRVLERRIGSWWRGQFDWTALDAEPGAWRARITRRS